MLLSLYWIVVVGRSVLRSTQASLHGLLDSFSLRNYQYELRGHRIQIRARSGQCASTAANYWQDDFTYNYSRQLVSPRSSSTVQGTALSTIEEIFAETFLDSANRTSSSGSRGFLQLQDTFQCNSTWRLMYTLGCYVESIPQLLHGFWFGCLGRLIL